MVIVKTALTLKGLTKTEKKLPIMIPLSNCALEISNQLVSFFLSFFSFCVCVVSFFFLILLFHSIDHSLIIFIN
jgi:hypothetical protein